MKTRKAVLLSSVLTALFLAYVMVHPEQLPIKNSAFELVAPSVIGVAHAEGNGSTTFPQDEAGISAYFQTSAINLSEVRSVFRTIEVETADYIIGSVPVTDYPESEDVHVYVHKDGWVLAYYLKSDPAGKIFDWRDYDGTTITTKLENTLAVVAGSAGVPFSGGTYYDFRYPNATHMMLIAEGVSRITDNFEVVLPGSYGYFERSWSLAGGHGNGPHIKYLLDGTEIFDSGNAWSFSTFQGTLTSAQLSPNTSHVVEIDTGSCCYEAFGGLALIYRVP